MAEVYQRLGTVASVVGTNLADNGATANTWTIISSIIICNTSSTAYTYSIATSTVSGAGQTHIAFSAPIAGYDTVVLVAGVCLDPTNRYLVAYSSNAAVQISAFGVKGP